MTFLRKQSNLANRVWNSRDKSKSSVVTLLSNHSFLERSRKECIFCKSLSLSPPLPPCLIIFSHMRESNLSLCVRAARLPFHDQATHTVHCVYLASLLFSPTGHPKVSRLNFTEEALRVSFMPSLLREASLQRKCCESQQTLKAASRGCVRLKH